MKDWLWLTLAILGEVAGTTALKASNGFTKLIPSLIVVIGYSIAFYGLSYIMKTLPVGIVYAVWSGVGIVLIALIGKVFFQQNLDVSAYIGIGFIICGVVIINLFSSSNAH